MSKSKSNNKTNQKIIKVPGVVETGSPKLVELLCNRCGGTLVLTDKEHASCPHCGVMYLIDQPEDLNIHIHLQDADEKKKTVKTEKKPTAQPVSAAQSGSKKGTLVGLAWLVIILAALFVILKPLLQENHGTLGEQSDMMAQFCLDVFAKDMKHVTQEDWERIKYMEPYSIEHDNQSNIYYVYKYSMTDYMDCESPEEFEETIERWKSHAISPSQTRNPIPYDRFTGLTALRLDKSGSMTIPKNAPVSCIWVSNLDTLQQEMEESAGWNPERLRELNLTNQRGEDLSVLSKFPNLESLKIEGPSHDQIIPDLKGLANCTKLQSLELSYGDAYIGLSTLSDMHDLKRLYIDHIVLENATFLLDMPELEYLRIEVGKGNNLDNLQNLTKLQELILEDKEVHISELPDQPNLRKLVCTLMDQEEVDNLIRFQNLEYLSLIESSFHNKISLKELGKLENLKEVSLGGFFGVDYTDMEEIINLPGIEKLSIFHGAGDERKFVLINPERLHAESNLKKFTCMKFLFVNASNGEVDWSFFDTLQNVEDVTLFKCDLEDIGFLSGLPKLTTLDLEQNALRDYSPLLNCPQLQQVYTWGNPEIDAKLGDGVEVIPHENIDSWY